MADKKNYFVYEYTYRSDVVDNAVNEGLKIIYNNSFPKTDYDKEILPECKKLKESGKGPYLEGDDGEKYLFPLDFYYCPQSFQNMVTDNLCDAYGITRQWEDHIDILSDYITNVNDRCVIEARETDENGRSLRTYKRLPDITTVLTETLGSEELAKKAMEKVMEYINNAKEFYRFGLIDENQFRGGIVFHSPNTNRKTVEDAWKHVYGKTITIPEDDNWMDMYDERLDEPLDDNEQQNKPIETDEKFDILSRLSRLYCEKYDKHMALIKPEVDKILEEVIPKGCWTLGVKMKGKNVVAKIDLDSNETKYIDKNIEIDNKYVWDYIVNVKYYDNRKIISLFETEEKFDPITLGQTIYKQIDDIYNDEEYLKLVEKCRIMSKVDDTDAIEKI